MGYGGQGLPHSRCRQGPMVCAVEVILSLYKPLNMPKTGKLMKHNARQHIKNIKFSKS